MSSFNIRFETVIAHSAGDAFRRDLAILSKAESLNVDLPSGINPSVNHSWECLGAQSLETVRVDSGVMDQDTGTAIEVSIWVYSNRDWVALDSVKAECDAFTLVVIDNR